MANDAPELDQARMEILRATLTHVPFDGWSDKAIAAGIVDASQRESLSILAFPRGPEDLAEYYSAHADTRMATALDPEAIAKLRIRERILAAVHLRLTQAEGEREALKALMTWFAFPANQPCAVVCLYRTVDAIWHAIGDTSTDFNFYTKRAILAGVLAATVLYWLGDESEGAVESHTFLDRRINDVMAFEKAKGKAQEWLAELPDPFRILRGAAVQSGKRNDDGPAPGDQKS